jgi:hypothetical protein
MSEIAPEKRTYTHTIIGSGENKQFLSSQIEQFIKDMEKNPDIAFTIISIEPAAVVSYMQEPVDAS